MHVFYLVFSIRCKICKICRSLTLRQKVSVLTTAVLETFHAFYCLIRQSWTWGNHISSNDSKKRIPRDVMRENTMEKLLKVNPLWANTKLQTLVGLNAANIEKSFVFPDPLILALLFSHTCPRASLSGLENTCKIQKIFWFSPVLLWEMKLFFFKRKHKRAIISFHPQIIWIVLGYSSLNRTMGYFFLFGAPSKKAINR